MVLTGVEAFSNKKQSPIVSSSRRKAMKDEDADLVVVVGKIIVDDYYREEFKQERFDESSKSVTIGGGGPQAAWGAAAALAILKNESFPFTQGQTTRFPPRQPVAFVGPIGEFGEAERTALNAAIGMAIETIQLVEEPSLLTPKIQLWHDEKQDVHWKPLNNSWGANGADELWKNRPSSQDIISLFASSRRVCKNLHLILEMGEVAAGGGKDSMLLEDPELLHLAQYIAIEPVAFPEEDEDTGVTSIPIRDVISCKERLTKHLPDLDMIVPDSHLAEALTGAGFWKQNFDKNEFEVVARYGPEGSRIFSNYDDYVKIPAASLESKNGKPINPTGAGNAFSAALSTCRSKGLTLYKSTCIATAIGAVVCEYEHLPPWTYNILDRIRRATSEVTELTKDNSKS